MRRWRSRPTARSSSTPPYWTRATKFGWPFSRDEILEKLYELGGQWREVKAALEQPSREPGDRSCSDGPLRREMTDFTSRRARRGGRAPAQSARIERFARRGGPVPAVGS